VKDVVCIVWVMAPEVSEQRNDVFVSIDVSIEVFGSHIKRSTGHTHTHSAYMWKTWCASCGSWRQRYLSNVHMHCFYLCFDLCIWLSIDVSIEVFSSSAHMWRTWCASCGSWRRRYLSNLISSRLWSKKSLLFLMILMQTISPLWRSRHCTAFEKAAEPRYSFT